MGFSMRKEVVFFLLLTASYCMGRSGDWGTNNKGRRNGGGGNHRRPSSSNRKKSSSPHHRKRHHRSSYPSSKVLPEQEYYQKQQQQRQQKIPRGGSVDKNNRNKPDISSLLDEAMVQEGAGDYGEDDNNEYEYETDDSHQMSRQHYQQQQEEDYEEEGRNYQQQQEEDYEEEGSGYGHHHHYNEEEEDYDMGHQQQQYQQQHASAARTGDGRTVSRGGNAFVRKRPAGVAGRAPNYGNNENYSYDDDPASQVTSQYDNEDYQEEDHRHHNKNQNQQQQQHSHPQHLMDTLFRGAGKEALYDAYNQLHTLAQEYDKPFDAPAVVVVGHQSSGKSALIEALMGFQFNQVGGGTKTRRPVALRLQYNPKCREPRFYLIGEDGVERPMKLNEIQDYIEKENRRLELDPSRSFESKEIHIRMEYKHSPNMILIDTPGLIAAPRTPRGRSGGPGSAVAKQRALHAASREAEQLVVEKMRCEDYIILCVEDNSDWKHGSTREIVQKADPELSRTVIVNTKFDTKVPQFGTASDVEDFLRAGILDNISPHRLGGPFFTSVPSGRVGRAFHGRNDYSEFSFSSDEHFVKACSDAENADQAISTQRLKRSNNKHNIGDKVAVAGVTSRIGLSKLRSFLEQRVDECYRRNVKKIIPMLQAEYVTTERRLQACESELEALSVERLKAGAEAFCDEFCLNLRKAIQGSILAPPSLFGETLKQETASAGSFHAVNGCPMAVSDRTWDRLVDTEVGGRGHRLYGGSQYHRTLREFNLATRCLRLASLQEDEIINAAGLGETHDGVNYLNAACTIAVEKARSSFDPLLQALQLRMKHVMGRLCPVAEYMLRETRDRSKRNSFTETSDDDTNDAPESTFEKTMDISQNPQFKQLIRTIFDKFVKKCSESAASKCRDDLNAITRYVSWNLDDRSGGGFQRALPDQTDVLSVYQVVLKQRAGGSADDSKPTGKKGKPNEKSSKGEVTESKPLTPMVAKGVDHDYQNLLRLMEEAVMQRDANRTTLLVGGLVQHIVANWQLQFCRSVTSKFNCYFMLPLVDGFHQFMRRELQKVYEGEGDSLSDVFDLTSARRALKQQRDELVAECLANKQLQEKFRTCTRMMGGKGQQKPFTLRPELSLDEE